MSKAIISNRASHAGDPVSIVEVPLYAHLALITTYFAWCARKLCYYGDVIHSFDWKSAVEHDGGV